MPVVAAWRKILAGEGTWGCAAIVAHYMIVAGVPGDSFTTQSMNRLCTHVYNQLTGRLQGFNFRVKSYGMVREGHAHSNYPKQLTQQASVPATVLGP